MQRLTARLLLVMLLVSVIAPATLAVSAPASHACCLRKPLHNRTTHQAQFRSRDCCQHNCCRPLTVKRAQPQPRAGNALILHGDLILAESSAVQRASSLCASHAVRAPPAPSCA